MSICNPAIDAYANDMSVDKRIEMIEEDPTGFSSGPAPPCSRSPLLHRVMIPASSEDADHSLLPDDVQHQCVAHIFRLNFSFFAMHAGWASTSCATPLCRLVAAYDRVKAVLQSASNSNHKLSPVQVRSVWKEIAEGRSLMLSECRYDPRSKS